MFKSRTTFIVGAGASCEVRLNGDGYFPSGAQLAEAIEKLLAPIGNPPASKDEEFAELFGRFYSAESAELHIGRAELHKIYRDLADMIARGVRLKNSIDNYVDTHQGNERLAALAKLAIGYLILRYERLSVLQLDQSKRRPMLQPGKLRDTWLQKFAELIFRNIPLSELDTAFTNVSIICFNYDRCIEQYLIHHIDAVYAVGLQDAARLVSKLQILRPYGSLGSLDQVPFGCKTEHCDLAAASRSIKTYTEREANPQVIYKYHGVVAHAHRIVFLGFGFHDQNIELLRPSNGTRAMEMYATAFDVSKPRTVRLEKTLPGYFAQMEHIRGDRKIVVENMTCAQLFREYDVMLSE